MNENIPQALVESARGYEALFVPALFEPWTRHVLDAAELTAGHDVLDVACGTGVLTRGARSRVGAGSRVAGVDIAPGMIAAAKEIEPGIEWQVGSAESLEFADASFDRVVSQFGMMFFEDRQKSVDEMFRVLKPGGALAIAVWRPVEHNPTYADIIAVLQEHVGTAAADALRLPYSLGDSSKVTALLEKGGFSDIDVEAKIQEACFPATRTMVEAELRGWLPLFDILLDEEKISEVLVASDATLARYAAPSGEAIFPTSANIFTARKE